MVSQRKIHLFSFLFALIIGLLLSVGPVLQIHADEQTSYRIKLQGNDSNCDFIAVANGIQNIGGDGERAYWSVRSLVPQRVRDYKEAFYTTLGPQGSDQPFTPNNLGAAPEAFTGVYQALGYDAVLLAAHAGDVDLDFVRAIRDRLAVNPERSFVHLWITPYAYDPTAQLLTVEETGEQVSMLYPYHEVAAMLAADPERLVILDGLVGYPYELALNEVASLLRGFNQVLVVRRNDGSLEDHQRFESNQTGQPYVVTPLGGPYLAAARTLFGDAYQTWGAVIGQPLRVFAGDRETVMVPGAYVQYMGTYVDGVTLAPLGEQMATDLLTAGFIAPDQVALSGNSDLENGIRLWVESQFGSVDRFYQLFGHTITPEFWLSQEQMNAVVPAGMAFSFDTYPQPSGYIVVLTERAMIVWTAERGAWLVPLGHVSYERYRLKLGVF